jgi:phosphoglycolate phosphatase-like HAD superfamily hydrolase
MPRRLVLWDIDGTLIRAGQVGADIFATAVEHVVGRHPGQHGVKMGGKTDPQIALEILAGMGIDAREGARHLPLVLGRLETELAGAVELMLEKGRLLPGVPEVLARLHAESPDVVQSVLTGNTAANAITKLATFGLDQWLDLEIGAYGSDNSDRRTLVPVAIERTATRRGWVVATNDVWVVGDTPHDLACARAGGARCVLVGTGTTPLTDLQGIGADAVLDDLSDVDAVISLLRS